MAKGSRGRRGMASRQFRLTPYPLPSCDREDLYMKRSSEALDKKDWEDVTCSVCMECPHNAVLLLCSSHDKGCRPYMCGTSFRYSNCLDQYKKAYAKGNSSDITAENPILSSDDKCEATELACPLCRGQVKGWTVVEPARDFLNAKKRNCMQDDCSFVGAFKELRKHMKTAHPSARPREVDPILEQKFRRIERDREHDDVISTIRSTMPGAMFFGDYVIEGDNHGFDSDEENREFDADAAGRNDAGFDRNLVNVFLLLHAFGPSGDGMGRRLRQPERSSGNESAVDTRHTLSVSSLNSSDDDNDNDNDSDNDHGDGGLSLVSRLRRHGRVLLGRSGRRRRQREADGGGER
ncbi:uncharacterized protein LOC126660705 [Mercurialis annua]|uniref:uncharacterized protein LOC126660705 n=1 Tax=Mercurialis annua TaxID=3986 RepID=UPI0021608924|nr:uncharacterized protein LOC126660705 [Mercurialis annua]XP_050210303.1 uncharacterized protein LOC126660705 [Mercurialis annua]XP_050210304.1 uncharacterized protein LOC126660705 [Mercurialis annua]XP_050210305.1 uncharacterized protein LOC126660705 [Mercurialis annua]